MKRTEAPCSLRSLSWRTDRNDVPSIVVLWLFSNQFGAVPERQGESTELQEKHEAQTSTDEQALLHAVLFGFVQVSVVPEGHENTQPRMTKEAPQVKQWHDIK